MPLVPPPARREPRQQVQLPRELHQRFADLCHRNGVTAACLLYGWYVAAARVVQEGLGRHLPPGGRPRRGTVGEVVGTPWKQGDAEYEACRRLLAEAGTDPTAVLRAAVQAYVDAGGDVLAMRWPPDFPDPRRTADPD